MMCANGCGKSVFNKRSKYCYPCKDEIRLKNHMRYNRKIRSKERSL
jgi:hypothetical protein